MHGPCPRSPGQRLACPWWRCARSRAPGERPQHQHRADRRPPGQHLASAQGVPTSTGTSTSAVPPVQQVTAWRARGGGVGGHPTPAPGECHSTRAGQIAGNQASAGRAPAVEVCQWCQCIQPQHLASAPGVQPAPAPAPGRPWAPGNQASAGQITAPLLQGERPRCFSNTSTGKLGQRLACPWWRCARSRAPGERPQHHRRAGRGQPGQRLACPSCEGVGVVPVHPTPAPGERPQHQGRADSGQPGQRLTCQSCEGVPVNPAPAPAPAPGHQVTKGPHLACPSCEGVPDRGHLASGHSTRAGQTVGHQASTWRAPQACHQPQHPRPPGHKASAPGHRLACHQRWRCSRGAWALPPGHHQRRADRRQPGEHLACPSCEGVGVVPVHPTPEPGERTQHKRRADHGPPGHKVNQASAPGVPAPAPAPGHQFTRPAPGVPVVEVCQWCMGLATRPAPGERPQHQRRAGRGQPGHRLACHQRWRCGRGASASNARTWRAATAPGPGRSRATRSPDHQASAWHARAVEVCPCIQPQHQRPRPAPGRSLPPAPQRPSAPAPGVPPAVEVWAWCQCIQCQNLASGHSTRAGQIAGHQVTRSPGQRLACPSGGGVPVNPAPAPAPAPGHQFNR